MTAVSNTSGFTIVQMEGELKKIYRERKKKDPSYSFRTMAKDLDFNFSTLYRVLKGERRLGKHAAKDLAEKLNVQLTMSRPIGRLKKPDPFVLSRLNPLSETQVHWLSLAVLESMKLSDFRADASWVARRFGVRTEVIEALLVKMETEGLLSRANGEWRDLLEDAASVGPDVITGAIVRRILKDMMAASAAAVDQVAFDNREHSFAIFPIATRQLPLLKKKLNALQREFGAFAAKSKFVKDEIYAFHLGFFPVTKSLSKDFSR